MVNDVLLAFGGFCRFLRCYKAILMSELFDFDAISLVHKCRVTTPFHRQLEKIRINFQEVEISTCAKCQTKKGLFRLNVKHIS